MVTQQHVIDCDAGPELPDPDWRVAEHRPGGQLIWDPQAIRLYLSERQKDETGRNNPRGHELRQELAYQPVLNVNVLQYLRWWPDLIPDEWKLYQVHDVHRCARNYTCFWGTIFEEIGSRKLFVGCLAYFGNQCWREDYRCLDDYFRCLDSAAVLVKPESVA